MENKEQVMIYFEKKEPLVIVNSTFNSTYDFALTDYELEKARQNLDETEDKRRKCLEILKDKLGSDKTFSYRTDDGYLLRYLRYEKFDCEKAYKIIRNFYSVRRKYAEYLTIPPDLEFLFNRGFLTYLPYTDEDGNILYWINFRKLNLDEISTHQFIQMAFIFSDIITLNPRCQINGCVGVWDFRGVTARLVAKFLYPSILRIFLNLIQNCYPWKTKSVTGIHCNKFIQYAYSIIRPFLKQKIADRVMLLGSDMSELHQYINPLILPKEYGGSLEESECSATDNIVQNLNYLKYERSFVNIESSI